LKIYFIDKYRKNLKISKAFKDVDIKESFKFKKAKEDFVIATELPAEEDIKDAKRLDNIIFITEDIKDKNIWNLATKFKTIDIIDMNMNEDYIINRCRRIMEEYK